MAMTTENDELAQLPISAVQLIQWLDRQHQLPGPLNLRMQMHKEEDRLRLAADLGKREMIDCLKQRYKL